MSDKKTPTIIIGAGWAGIAAAVELTRKGHPCLLLEAAQQAGGRSRSVHYPDISVDNGQHLMIGAYHHMLRSMKHIGINIDDMFLRESLRIDVYPKNKNTILIKTAKLPAPFHLAGGIAMTKGLPVMDKIHALSFMTKVAVSNFKIAKDCTVKQYLDKFCHSQLFIDAFLEPLCLAALNTPIELASTQVFFNVLRDSFKHNASDSDLLLPKKCLSQIYPDHALRYLKQHGSDYKLDTRVSEILVENGKVTGIRCSERMIKTNKVIVATTPTAASRIMQASNMPASMYKALNKLRSQPVSTVYLQFNKNVRLPYYMTGMTGTITQWLFDRRFCGQPGLIAAVMSAKGLQTALDKTVLIDVVKNEIAALFPELKNPVRTIAIREKRATFSAVKNIQSLRPTQKTEIKGCYLAGDYTLTPYPSTIEGAVMSGIQCAKLLLKQK